MFIYATPHPSLTIGMLSTYTSLVRVTQHAYYVDFRSDRARETHGKAMDVLFL